MSTSSTGRVGVGTDAQRPSGGAAGDMWVATDSGLMYVYDGSAWRTFSRIDAAQTVSGVKTISAQPLLTAGSIAITEISAPSGVASKSVVYADSTAHRLAMKNNNGTATNVAGFSDFTTTVKTGSKGGDYTRTSSTLADADGTNLKLTVTIPTGFKLIVMATGTVKVATAVTFGDVALTDSVSGVIDREQTNIATGGNYYPFALVGEIDGDGASHVVTLQFASTDNTTTVSIANGANTYPKMVFWMSPSN